MKGQVAKEQAINRIKEAFGNDFIGLYEKKVYVWGQENGERMQIALALTIPKNPINVATNSPDSSNDTPTAASSSPTEMTEEDKNKVKELMRKLGVTPTSV